MTIYVNEEDTKLFENKGYSYEDVAETVNIISEYYAKKISGITDETVPEHLKTQIPVYWRREKRHSRQLCF